MDCPLYLYLPVCSLLFYIYPHACLPANEIFADGRLSICENHRPQNTKIEQKKQVNLYKKMRPHIAARYARRVVRGFRGLLVSTKVCPFSCTKKIKENTKKTPISV